MAPTAPNPIAAMIDHTLLKPDATADDIRKVCAEARRYHFASVCVNTAHLALVTSELKKDSTCPTLPIAVVGFPLGACTTETKVFEVQEALRLGAREIDMVIALGALKSESREGDLWVEADIRAVVTAAAPLPVKVILETALLTDAQKIRACQLAVKAGAAFVKTSTGFSTAGATEHDVALMRKTVGPNVGVKASGGIRTLEDAQRMIAAGANRLGVSASVAIVEAAGGGPIAPQTSPSSKAGY